MLPILALAAVLGLTYSVITPAFWPVDETAHVAYVDHLAHGEGLATIDTPIDWSLPYPGLYDRLRTDLVQGRNGRMDIWTSNHPPLAYAIQAVALRVGGAVAGPAGALLAARLTSVVWFVLGVWASMQLAFLLAPGLRSRHGRESRMNPVDIACATGALVAVTPTLGHLAGLVFNDVPAFALSTICLYLGVRAVYQGVTPRSLYGMGLVAGAAALTRVSCLPAVAVMGLLVAYAHVRQTQQGRSGTRSGRTTTGSGQTITGSGQVGANVGSAALGLGDWVRGGVVWTVALLPAAAFWVRNMVLYGSPTGASALFEKFGRSPNAPVVELVQQSQVWLDLWNRMLSDLTTARWTTGPRQVIIQSLLAALLMAGALAFGLRIGGSPAPRPKGGGTRRGGTGADASALTGLVRRLAARPILVAWCLCLLLPVGLLISALSFHAAGGSLHGRYLLGGYAVTAAGIVVLLSRLPSAWIHLGRLAAILVAVPVFVANTSLMRALLSHQQLAWSLGNPRPVPTRLNLPYLLGDVTPTLFAVLGFLASVLLVVITTQHVREDQAVEVDERSEGSVRRRSAISSSAAP